jgi:hypothetical protein
MKLDLQTFSYFPVSASLPVMQTYWPRITRKRYLGETMKRGDQMSGTAYRASPMHGGRSGTGSFRR